MFFFFDILQNLNILPPMATDSCTANGGILIGPSSASTSSIF